MAGVRLCLFLSLLAFLLFDFSKNRNSSLLGGCIIIIIYFMCMHTALPLVANKKLEFHRFWFQ